MKNKGTDAITLLTNDHETVTELFKRFASASRTDVNGKKAKIVEEIIAALEIHATIEEELFYPAGASPAYKERGARSIRGAQTNQGAACFTELNQGE